MQLGDIITKVTDRVDRVKYHGEHFNTLEFLESLLHELQTEQDDMEDREAVARAEGFAACKRLVIHDVLSKSTLKTRGVMITAAEGLEDDGE